MKYRLSNKRFNKKYNLLEIARDEINFLEQLCPYNRDGRNCGDWCPLFGEITDEGATKKLIICHNTLIMDTLIR